MLLPRLTPLSTAAATRLAPRSHSAPARYLSTKHKAGSLPDSLPLHASQHSRKPVPLPADSPSPLQLLKTQPSHYIQALLLGRRYLLTPGDVLTVPRMKHLTLGTNLALTRVLEVGSRDYTLRAPTPLSLPPRSSTPEGEGPGFESPAMVDVGLRPETGLPRDWQRFPDSLGEGLGEEVVSCRLTVIEHLKGRMFEVEKFKRRKGYRRTLRSKLGFTKLRVGDIVLGDD